MDPRRRRPIRSQRGNEQALRGLQKAGRPIALAVFPHAEHGIYEYEAEADGARLDTRNPAGYLDMMGDYIRNGKLRGEYGHAILYRASGG